MNEKEQCPRVGRDVIELTLCGECGAAINADLCSYDCLWDDFPGKDRPTFTRRYVAEHAVNDVLETLQAHVGSCREWCDDGTRCNKPSEYVLWGKLIPPDGLGPRCYEHASRYVGPAALRSRSDYALINLGDLARELEEKETEDA